MTHQTTGAPHRRRRRRVGATVSLALLGVATMAAPAYADPPTNSSFENPDAPTGSWIKFTSASPTPIPGWTVISGSADVVDAIVTPADGAQWLDVDEGAAVQQSFPTTAGTGYTISWNYGANPECGVLEKTGTFSVEGSAVIPMAVSPTGPTDANWQSASTTFTGTGAPVTLQFANTGTGGAPQCGLAIDNIQIGIDAAVPVVDPQVAAGTIGAALLALAGWFTFRRRGNRAQPSS